MHNDALKGHCHEIFDSFLFKKKSPGPHMNSQIQFTQFFSFSRRYWLRVADTSMTTQTLEVFSQNLKEQSGKKGNLGVFTHPKAII